MRFANVGFDVFREGAQSEKCATHAKKATVKPKDMNLAKCLKNNQPKKKEPKQKVPTSMIMYNS